MNYRELLVGSLSAAAVCACSLLVSESSFASPVGRDASADVIGVMGGGFYVSGSYSPAFPSISGFSIRESGKESSHVRSYDKNLPTLDISQHGHFVEAGHSFKFSKGLLTSFDGAAGYSLGGARVEVEAGYRKFDALADGNYKHSDAHKFVAIARDAAITADNFFVVKVDAVTDMAVMLNACYDMIHADLPVSPYVCAGLGASFIDIANKVTGKFAYRGKVGVSYQLTPEISLIAGGFYHGLLDESYDAIPATNRVAIAGDAQAAVSAGIAHYGFNLGARFSFN